MKNEKSIQCPKCKNTNVSFTIIDIDNIKKGLVGSKSSLIWGLIMIFSGGFFLILGILNWVQRESKPGLIIGFGILLIFIGIQKAVSFTKRKKERLFRYKCDDCSNRWNKKTI